MQPDNRLHRVLTISFALALATAPALFLSACGDDDDDDDSGGSGNDGGASGRSGSGGSRAGSGGSGAGSGGRSGSGGSRAGSGGSSGGSGGSSGGSGGSGGSAGSDDDAGMEPTTEMFRDVSVEMTGMTPHIGNMMQFRVVSADDELVALGVLDTLEAAAVTFELPNSTPEGDHRLDFWADLNDNGNYNMPPADHSWREDIPADGVIEFAHNTTFTDIDDPAVTEAGDFTFNATDMTPHVGQMFELRVIEVESGRLVGRYVLSEIATADFDITLEGIIQPNTMYQVDFTADLNDNGSYDAPPTDHAWRELAESDNNDLTVDFAHGTNFTDVDF